MFEIHGITNMTSRMPAMRDLRSSPNGIALTSDVDGADSGNTDSPEPATNEHEQSERSDDKDRRGVLRVEPGDGVVRRVIACHYRNTLPPAIATSFVRTVRTPAFANVP